MPEIKPLRPGDPPRLGDYSLRGRLGQGGQGVVYLGESATGERAAIKLLHVRFTGEAQARSRFARELAAARRVAAFCTARVLSADLDGETPYIASELIEGPSLRQVVERDGPLAGETLERLAIGTATALTAIHQAGIAHRDFKPDNVLLAADGPRVVDFGIAKIIDESGTITTRAVGTPAYMAPEQIAGERVGFPADVFAWGSTMVFTATGKAPFGGDTIVATLNRVINHEADLSGLPDDLREIVAGCLNKDQSLRPTADGLLKRLLGHPVDEVEASEEVLAEGAQAATMDLTQAEEPVRTTRRRSVVAGGLAVLGAAAAFLFVQFGFTPDGDITPTSAATSPTPTPTRTLSTGSALLDRIRATGRLRVGYRDGLPGVSLGHPPRGFEIEVAEHIAKALKVPEGGVRFVPVGYAAREEAVEEGKVDLVIANFSIDAADPGRVAFAGPYYVAHRDVLVRAGTKISTLRDLRGKKICVTSGLTTAAMIRDRGVDFVAVEDDDISKCASQVADGRSDALAGDDVVIAGFGARLRAAKLKIAGIRLTSERYGVALRRGDSVACRAINDVIGSMYADGTMKELLQRHLGRVDFRFETELPRPEGC
ncbi:bifunctional serine/threonine-protein kinase/glutamate ABC transporter substrate-binding protein [Streptosporangium subroseum]|uniref:bifunctional serine/threonine-protein kinase/glutamate ABC transporter substrate-binding protein n=1 Tax=Streptosporangium subroseum TaxID=106412 RepID=UPI00308DAE62|nr:bifunctional serine/threonine-protein kinase/glutamate ABC transporter substrate-binding protein [Streptosporangium subroseum]